MKSSQAWVPDPYDISKPPSLASTLHIGADSGLASDFPRLAKWCPDGSVVIAQCESRTFQFFNVSSQDGGAAQSSQSPVREFRQPSPILDFIWYPTASPRDPASFCFVASVRECPVKLLDASDGRLRASYRIVDHRERQIAPHSLTFNLTAQKLYCGFEDAIEVFDLSQPGEGTRLRTTSSKKSKDGLKGLISSLAFSPSCSSDESFYAAGSFTPTANNIAMFSDAQPEPLMHVGGGPRAGVTQLHFNPMKPHILYAGYRGHASGMVYSWDIRSDIGTPLEIFRASPSNPKSRTNQKMRFDIDISGRLLSIGDQEGNISIFELDSQSAEEDLGLRDTMLAEPSSVFHTKVSAPQLQFKAHADAVGSVAFHPFKSTLLSASGSRHFLDIDQAEGNDDSDTSDDEDLLIQIRRARRPQPVTFDSTMKIWDLKNE
ncbi:WD40-repeat-containing domain protein [Flammula alnicola]|nr:WD40-repeat-containing domain protein [Flammula alnicola]